MQAADWNWQLGGEEEDGGEKGNDAEEERQSWLEEWVHERSKKEWRRT